MVELFISLILTAILLVSGLLLLLNSLRLQRRRPALQGAVLLATGAVSGFWLRSNLNDNLVAMRDARSGEAVYSAWFGNPAVRCVQITRFSKLNSSVRPDRYFLKFAICEEELKRLESKADSSIRRAISDSIAYFPQGLQRPGWFETRAWGDSLTILLFRSEKGGELILLYNEERDSVLAVNGM